MKKISIQNQINLTAGSFGSSFCNVIQVADVVIGAAPYLGVALAFSFWGGAAFVTANAACLFL